MFGDTDGNVISMNTAKLCSLIKTSPLPTTPELLRFHMILNREIMSKEKEFSKEALAYRAKKVIENDTKYIKLNTEYNRIKQQLSEVGMDRKTLIDKKNEAVTQKIELTQRLIECEEERLNTAKENIELKIKVNKANTEAEQLKNSLELISLNKQSDISKRETKNEEKSRRIQELEEVKSRMDSDYKSLELEYAVLRKNYNDRNMELENTKKKCELVNLEYINLANQLNNNEKEALSLQHGNIKQDYERLKNANSKLTDDNLKLREELNSIKDMINGLKNEKERAEIQMNVAKNDFEKKLLEQEKVFNDQMQKKQSEFSLKMDEFFNEKKISNSFKENWEGEKAHLADKISKLEKDLELITREHDSDKTKLDELARDKNKIELDLQDTVNDNIKKLESLVQPIELKAIKEEIEKTYIANESRLKDEIMLEHDRNKRLRNRLLALRSFTITVKNLCKNIAPQNRDLADAIAREPIETADESNKGREEDLKIQIDQLHREIKQYKENIELLKIRIEKDDSSRSIIRQEQPRIERVQNVGSNDKLNEENDELYRENSKLKSDLSAIKMEVRKLKDENSRLTDDNQYLQQSVTKLTDDLKKTKRQAFDSENGIKAQMELQKEVKMLKTDKSALERPGSSTLKAENIKLLEEIKRLKQTVLN